MLVSLGLLNQLFIVLRSILYCPLLRVLDHVLLQCLTGTRKFAYGICENPVVAR